MTYAEAAPAKFKRRWGDDDRHLGPFTWAPEKRGGHGWGVMLDSGDDEHPGCHVRLYLPIGTLLCELPQIVQPHRKKVFVTSWDEATIQRLGRNWYYDEHPREYGFNFVENALHVHYGPQTHSWPGSASKCFFLPWLNWRFIRHTHYTSDGQRVRTFWEDSAKRDRQRARKHGESHWPVSDLDFARALRTVDFTFLDFDGEEIVAKTRVEEREWRFGTGWFSWLSLFRKPKISRSLHIDFTKETGRRKGSWKGGTVGHSCDIEPGQTPESAFRAYCASHEMKFVAPVPPAVDESVDAARAVCPSNVQSMEDKNG